MSFPCCTPSGINDGRFFCDFVLTSQECLDRDGTVGLENTPCFDEQFEPNGWRCNPEIIGSDITVDCCFPGENEIATFLSNCDTFGGFVITPDNPCIPPVPPPDCSLPVDDRPSLSGLRWTTDLQGTVAFGLDPEGGDRGFTTLTTDHLTRPQEPERGDEQPCVHLQSPLVVLDDGFAYVEACSKPDRTTDDSVRVSYGSIMAVEDSEGVLQEGYQYFIGAIHLPWWTEAILRSHQERCQGILK